MSGWISLLNDVAVSLFGSILSASFCGALRTRRSRLLFWLSALIILLLQGWIYSVWDAELLRRLYPLMVHLPLALVLCGLTKSWLWPVISVFASYLCCQMRRWMALLVMELTPNLEWVQDLVELIVTLPLLVLLLRFVAPTVRGVARHPARIQLQFGVIPFIYYVFDYLTVVYTDLLVSGKPVVVEFMPFVCSVAYLVFWLYYSTQQQKRFQLQQVQKVLSIQLNQSVREISALRESQALTRRYRHDLRHHLQYLSSCIENEQYDHAQNYIATICREIEMQRVQRYCENEAVNLILSAFAARAQKDGVEMRVQGALPATILVTDSDMCVLFSNALENALHACRSFAAHQPRLIDVQFYQRDGKFFLQVTNPCEEGVWFENGIPVSDRPDHGIGVQSITAIVQQYGGVCTFLVQDGSFILRLSI